MKKTLIFIITFIIISNFALSQIGIYPQVVFMNQYNRSGNLKIMNYTDQPKEVEIDIRFGYPGYDSLGNVTLIYDDKEAEQLYSAQKFIKVFPKKLMLGPKEEQVIRFMARNVGDLQDGTYYSRVFVISKNPPQEIDSNYTEGEIQARLEFRFTLMSVLIFQKGTTNCNVDITDVISYNDSANVNFLIGFEREGNSPFFGTAEVNIYDRNNDLVAEKKEVTPIYFDTRKAFKFEKSKFDKGEYKVEITLTNEHKDVPDDFKIPFEAVTKEFIVNVESEM